MKSNKPSWADAPGNAEWLAQDYNGVWYWYLCTERPLQGNWSWLVSDEGAYIRAMSGKPNPDWLYTLEKRPKNTR